MKQARILARVARHIAVRTGPHGSAQMRGVYKPLAALCGGGQRRAPIVVGYSLRGNPPPAAGTVAVVLVFCAEEGQTRGRRGVAAPSRIVM